MRKITSNINKNQKNILCNKIKQGILSALIDYDQLYNEEERTILKKYLVDIDEIINGSIQYERLFEIEKELKPFIFKCWKYEEEQGSRFISWLKDNSTKGEPQIISSTFGGYDNAFCDSKVGFVYDVDKDGFLGACNKDAATLIEDESKETFFTIGELSDGRIVNSYNFATLVITPKQALDRTNNDYISKHNEIILDARYIKRKSVICLSDSCYELASELSEKYNIPLEEISEGMKK